jgi:hypothetical protein
VGKGYQRSQGSDASIPRSATEWGEDIFLVVITTLALAQTQQRLCQQRELQKT